MDPSEMVLIIQQLAQQPNDTQISAMVQSPELLPYVLSSIGYLLKQGHQPVDLVNAGIATELVLATLENDKTLLNGNNEQGPTNGTLGMIQNNSTTAAVRLDSSTSSSNSQSSAVGTAALFQNMHNGAPASASSLNGVNKIAETLPRAASIPKDNKQKSVLPMDTAKSTKNKNKSSEKALKSTSKEPSITKPPNTSNILPIVNVAPASNNNTVVAPSTLPFLVKKAKKSARPGSSNSNSNNNNNTNGLANRKGSKYNRFQHDTTRNQKRFVQNSRPDNFIVEWSDSSDDSENEASTKDKASKTVLDKLKLKELELMKMKLLIERKSKERGNRDSTSGSEPTSRKASPPPPPANVLQQQKVPRKDVELAQIKFDTINQEVTLLETQLALNTTELESYSSTTDKLVKQALAQGAAIKDLEAKLAAAKNEFKAKTRDVENRKVKQNELKEKNNGYLETLKVKKVELDTRKLELAVVLGNDKGSLGSDNEKASPSKVTTSTIGKVQDEPAMPDTQVAFVIDKKRKNQDHTNTNTAKVAKTSQSLEIGITSESTDMSEGFVENVSSSMDEFGDTRKRLIQAVDETLKDTVKLISPFDGYLQDSDGMLLPSTVLSISNEYISISSKAQSTDKDKRMYRPLPTAPSPKRRDGEKKAVYVGGLLKIPIFNAGMESLFLSNDDGVAERYFGKRTPAQNEEYLKANPHDEAVWIEHAMSELPSAEELNPSTLQRMSLNFTKSMSILSKGLQRNKSSESMWHFYLELYSRRAAPAEVKEMFDSAIKFTNSPSLKWQYYNTVPDYAGKLQILKVFLQKALVESLDSGGVFEYIVMIARLFVNGNQVDKAKSFFLSMLLECQSLDSVVEGFCVNSDNKKSADFGEGACLERTCLFRLFTQSELCLAWLLYIHLLTYDDLPTEPFYEYPHHYKLKTDPIPYMIIQFPQETRAMPKSVTVQVAKIFLYLVESWIGITTNVAEVVVEKNPFVCLLLNMRSFQPKSQDFRSVMSKAISKYGDMDEVFDIGFSVDLTSLSALHYKQTFGTSPLKFPMWNRLARIAVSTGDYQLLLISLINSIRVCFDGFEMLDTLPRDFNRVYDEAIWLYHIAFGLGEMCELPDSTSLPNLVSELSQEDIKSSFYLWMNFFVLNSLKIEIDGRLLSHTGSSEYSKLFDVGLSSVSCGKGVMWQEKLTFESIILDSKDVILNLQKALQTFTFTKPSYSAGIDNMFAAIVKFKDYTIPRKLVEIVLDKLPVDKFDAVVEVLIQGYPETLLSPRTLRQLLEVDLTRIRSVLHSILRICPNCRGLWKMAFEIEHTILGSNTESSSDCIRKQAEVFIGKLPKRRL